MKSPLEQLTAWIDRPNYHQGVLLYETLFGAGFMLTMLQQSDDDYNRSMLENALTKKYEELVAEEAATKASFPEPLVLALADGGRLMDERTLLKERMRGFVNQGITESDDLKDMAFRILAIKDKLDLIYGRKYFFLQNGFLPEAASALPEAESTTDLLKRRNTLRTYVTKYTQWIAEAYEPKRLDKLTKKLTAFQTELHDVQNRMEQLSQNATHGPIQHQ